MYTNPPTDLVVVFLSLTVLSMDFFFLRLKFLGVVILWKKEKVQTFKKFQILASAKSCPLPNYFLFIPCTCCHVPPINVGLSSKVFIICVFVLVNSDIETARIIKFFSLSLLPIITHSPTLFPFSSFDHIVFSFFYFLCYFSTYLVPVAFGPQ